MDKMLNLETKYYVSVFEVRYVIAKFWINCAKYIFQQHQRNNSG